MKNILVLCTGNSCRSQMAEGYFRFFSNGKTEIYSAGIEMHGVNPRAVATMLDDGIDIAGQTSNSISEYTGIEFDLVITVCDNAKEKCPVFPSSAVKLHHNFPDPAKAHGSEEEIVNEFRRVRNLIKTYCRQVIDERFG
jgi:arsenate reductase